LAVVAVTSAIHGAVGFGMNLLAVPVLVILDPDLVPGPAVAAGLVLSVLAVAREPVTLDRRLGWAVIGLVPGAAVAVLLLARAPADTLTAPLGVAVLIAVMLFAFRLHLAPTRSTLTAAGVASGFLATAASIPGPPIALVYARSEGSALRANLNAFFVITAAVSLTALMIGGHFGVHELRLSLALVPGVLVGFAISGPARPWLDRGRTHHAVLVLSAMAGVGAIVEGLSHSA
jgi:uncharacterized membrane protein YfcA